MNKDEELSYLMNPVLYDKYKELSSNESQNQFAEEKKFYRKRIQQMAKDCARYGIVKGVEEPPRHLIKAYDIFCQQCIDHFKMMDENEYYQTQYEDMDPPTTNITTNDVDVNNIEINSGIFRQQSNKIVTMDDFVKKSTNKKATQINPPKQRKVNVKDEKYRTKGLRKNKSNE